MKKLFSVFVICITPILFAGNVTGQDFSVSIDADKIFAAPYFYPKKRGESFQFNVKVKNNTDAAQTISIDKEGTFPYPVHNWVSIPNNNIVVSKGSTALFTIKVTIPSSIHEAPDDLRYYTLELKAKPANGSSTSFSGKEFYIIIDNEPPRDVSIVKQYATNDKVAVSFSAYDDLSHWYTSKTKNPHSNGIKSYTVKLKAADGSVIASGNLEGSAYQKELVLSTSAIRPNTLYTATVTATDLPGNTKDASINVKTAPAVPVNLNGSVLHYKGITLQWKPSEGASHYKVYLYENGSTNGKLLEQVSSNSIIVIGLEMGTDYQLAVTAVSEAGESGYSAKYSFTTPKVTIVGPAVVCESDNFNVEGLIPGATVGWSVSNENIATVDNNGWLRFKPWNYGVTSLIAEVSYKGEISTASKTVSIGHPEFEIGCLHDFGNGSAAFFAAPKEGGGDLYMEQFNYHWYYKGEHDYNDVHVASYMNESFVNVQPVITFPEAGNYIISMKATGWDGCEIPMATINYYSTGSGGPWNFSIFPNPASEMVTVQVELKPEIEKTYSMALEKEEPVKCEIQLWNKLGLIKTFKGADMTKQFSVRGLSKGFYYVHIIIGDKTYKRTLVID